MFGSRFRDSRIRNSAMYRSLANSRKEKPRIRNSRPKFETHGLRNSRHMEIYTRLFLSPLTDSKAHCPGINKFKLGGGKYTHTTTTNRKLKQRTEPWNPSKKRRGGNPPYKRTPTGRPRQIGVKIAGETPRTKGLASMSRHSLDIEAGQKTESPAARKREGSEKSGLNSQDGWC